MVIRLMLLAMVATAGSAAVPTITLVEPWPEVRFERPVDLDFAPDGLAYVLEQKTALVRVFDRSGDAATTVFMDLSDRVHIKGNEEGLLALALDPGFADNGRFFIYYTANKPRRGVLARYTLADGDLLRGDVASETVLVEVLQPWGNHNGADLQFGPDGMLYWSLGDGGSAGDPRGHGQDRSTLLGSILRLDVSGDGYEVPADNPFVGQAGIRPEIWAYGLRNVWRMGFDAETGLLWAADVGQNKWEEVHIIEPGGNHGWNIIEGSHPFKGQPTDDLVLPVFEYPHDQKTGGFSITGGFVYRGREFPALQGIYLCGDFVTGRYWGVWTDGDAFASRVALEGGPPVSSFAVDESGELFLTAFDGAIHRVTVAD